jgi:thiamine biosynthesis lipoprotein
MKDARFEFEAIGTHWIIDIHKELSSEEESSLLSKIQKRIDGFDRAYSRFRADSLVTQMSEIPGEYILPDDGDAMISLYKKMYDATGGLVTPLIGKVLVDAGYDAQYSLEEKTPIVPEPWEKIMVWENPKLTMLTPTLLDFGAGGKGYLVDIVSEILESEGVLDYCVDAGGDMRQRGDALRVGLENPNNKEEAIGVINLQNKSLCGSAGNRRVWGKYHHIINPETLTSPQEILAVWVTADSTLLADLCTTGLYFVNPEALLLNFEFEYCILYSDYSIKKSFNFHAEVFK